MQERGEGNSEMQRRIIDAQERYAGVLDASAAEDKARFVFAETIVSALETGTREEKVTALTALLMAVESKAQNSAALVAAYVSDHYQRSK